MGLPVAQEWNAAHVPYTTSFRLEKHVVQLIDTECTRWLR